jgi:hypothetical protein
MIPSWEQKYTAFNSFLLEETGYKTRYFLEGLFEGDWKLLIPECDDRPVFYNNYKELAKDILERSVPDRNGNYPVITTSPPKSEHAKILPDLIPMGDGGFCARQQIYPAVSLLRTRITGPISLDELTTEVARLYMAKCEEK